MNATASKVIGSWRGTNGSVAEVVYEGSDASASERWRAVDSLPAPVVRLNTALELSDSTRTILATTEIAHILPDRTGVLVLFDSNRLEVPAASMHFPPPDNAAIFNADGSLRFQLKNPWRKEGIFRAVVQIHRVRGSVELGVRACPTSYPVCETVYVIDATTDDLSKQLPEWVWD